MPSVPPPCQTLADEVAELQAQEEHLRAQVPTLAGTAAWTALANLGRIRQQLDAAHVALAECVRQHMAAALHGTLAVIYDGVVSTAPRVAGLWEMPPGGGAIQREVSHLTNGSFAFTGPLPASFALTLRATGDPIPHGFDFRSAALSAASLPTEPIRVEVVLGAPVRWKQSDIARVAAAFTPTTSPIGGPGIQGDLVIKKIDATLSDAGILVKASGDMSVTLVGVPQSGPFAARATLHVTPTTVPGRAEPVEVSSVSDLQVQLPAFASGFGDAVVSAVRGYITNLVTDQVRAFLRTELPAAVGRTFALAALPPGVVVSVRDLSIDAAALQFQPTLGAIGRSLSTFTPPSIPPP